MAGVFDETVSAAIAAETLDEWKSRALAAEAKLPALERIKAAAERVHRHLPHPDDVAWLNNGELSGEIREMHRAVEGLPPLPKKVTP